MSKGAAIDLGLNEAYNDLFSTQEDRDNAQRSYVTDLPAAEISDFPNHPFKVRMDQSMVELADSVKQYGVLVPSLVRPMPDGSYQMVSGHRRKRAAELAGLPGAFCATLGVVLPSFLVIYAVSFVLRQFSDLAVVQYAFNGIRAGVLALLLKALLSMYRQSPKGAVSYAVMAGAFVLTAFCGVDAVLVILASATVGLLSARMAKRRAV